MREGDNTYRLADNISDGIAGQSVNKATTDEATCDKAASDAGRDSPKGGEPDGKDAKCGIWFLSIACAMAVLVLSALTVKCVFLLRDAMALPMVLREIACAGVLVCVAAILYALYALARIFWRLPRIDQVSMTDADGKEVKASVQARLLHGYLRNKRDGNAFLPGCSENVNWYRKGPARHGSMSATLGVGDCAGRFLALSHCIIATIL